MLLLPAALPISPAAGAQPPTEKTEATVERLLTAPAATVDPALPAKSFGDWLDEIVLQRSSRRFTFTDCQSAAAGVTASTCLSIDIDMVSRHRQLRLVFGRDPLEFRGGLMSATKLEGVFEFDSLEALPNLVKRAMRPFPLDCPADAQLKLRESYAGLFEWCEDADGFRQGPARTWFSTGIYLMNRGQYADGDKTGQWIECNRFERCAVNTYTKGIRE